MMIKLNVVLLQDHVVVGNFDPGEIAAVLPTPNEAFAGNTELVFRSGKTFAVMESASEVLAEMHVAGVEVVYTVPGPIRG